MAISALQHEAARLVASCQDSGRVFDRRMRNVSFANAVMDARHLRTFAPGKLAYLVAYPHLADNLL